MPAMPSRLALLLLTLAAFAEPLPAAVICVNDADQLQAALDGAPIARPADAPDGNASSDDIRLRIGTYARDGGFTLNLSGARDVIVSGGWLDAACTTGKQDMDPQHTVLRGKDGQRVLDILAGSSHSGLLQIGNLTMRDGHPDENGGCLRFTTEAGATNTGLWLERNRFESCSSRLSYGGAASVETYGAALVHNNLIVNNSAPKGAGGGLVIWTGQFAIVSGNTVTGNVSLVGGGIAAQSSSALGGDHLMFANNLIWGNGDFDGTHNNLIYAVLNAGTAAFSHNLVSGFTFPQSGNGNFDADPLFVGPNDYRLRANSPAIDNGDDAPWGNSDLSDFDIGGHKRLVGSHVDIGAYEYSDAIFANGFDSP